MDRAAPGRTTRHQPPPERWLVLADDLTGAADCAIAFARQGFPASVSWSRADAQDAVLAVDADSRRLPPAAAAARHRALLEAHLGPDPATPGPRPAQPEPGQPSQVQPGEGRALLKKLDSTLRGQPAAELAETVRVLRERGRRALAIVAPAFPATGRTTEAGSVRLHGRKLEETSLWARDHSYPDANLPAVLEAAGLRTRAAPLATVRAGPEALGRLVRAALAAGVDALVCDAVVPGDLDVLAQATLPLAADLFWAGSGGLALALAHGVGRGGATLPGTPGVAGGILFVVGSVAEASRAASAALAVDGAVLSVAIAPATLRAGPADALWQSAAGRIATSLATGGDVLVQIDAAPDADLSLGAELARRLAELLRPAAPRLGALFATGGETALALLSALGVDGIRLLDEVEPGVPLGITSGALRVPVVTKAGAFGDAGTLVRCLSHLRRLRQPELPA